jgi:transglutaminase/protease-like cytokinesis protein 3
MINRLAIKIIVSLNLVLSQNIGFSQQLLSFNEIDNQVQSIEPSPAPDLAYSLTKNYFTESQKVRAIFSWIAQHIEYKTKRTIIRKSLSNFKLLKPVDSINVNSADEYVAESVIRNQSGLCEGYARLFKTLCDYAGIQSVLITGYARGDMQHVGTKFVSNHYWNAVFVDGDWHLLDVTWASGYFTYDNQDFVKHFDDYYFFTDPDKFILDHFPDDLSWTLLQDPKAPEEFYNAPFKQRDFIKYNVIYYSPLKGIIPVSIGDTLNFELKTLDPEGDKRKAVDTASMDSSMRLKFSSVVFLKPAIVGSKIHYQFVVSSEIEKWVHLIYNNDIVLRYKLEIKKSEN